MKILHRRPRRASHKNGLSLPVDIDFSTMTKEHGSRARGVGVHEGRIPNVLGRFTLDDVPIDFVSQDTVQRVHHAAKGIELLRSQRTLVDCFGFVALYSGEIDAADVPKKAERWLRFEIGHENVPPEEMLDGEVYALGAQYHDMNEPIIRHGVISAQTVDGEMMFFHVLGEGGPLALSGLREVQDTFRSYVVRPIENIRPY